LCFTNILNKIEGLGTSECSMNKKPELKKELLVDITHGCNKNFSKAHRMEMHTGGMIGTSA
jgi:hypothetical protein